MNYEKFPEWLFCYSKKEGKMLEFKPDKEMENTIRPHLSVEGKGDSVLWFNTNTIL